VLVFVVRELGRPMGRVVDDAPGSKKWEPPPEPTKVGILGVPVRVGPPALRIAVADSEMVEDGAAVREIEKLKVLLVLIKVLDKGTALLGGAAALMLRVLL
jgi:hypothetical protein